MPIVLLVVLAIALGVLFAVGLVAVVRAVQRDRPLIQGTADIEGFYITVLGALYAIFMAFMIFVVWTRFDSAAATVDQEADELVNVYRASRMLPQPLQNQFRQVCRDYAEAMSQDEWPAMARERASLRGHEVVERLWNLTYAITPSVAPDVVVRTNVVASVDRLTDLRRHRLLQSRTNLPGILYAILIFGGVLTIGFASLFSVEKFWPHALKACVLAAMISFMLTAIWTLDHPFHGDVHVDSSPFYLALDMMR